MIQKHVTKNVFQDKIGYLISPTDNGTMKISQAKKYDIPILTEHFLIDSLRLRQLQPTTSYSLTPSIPDRKSIEKPPTKPKIEPTIEIKPKKTGSEFKVTIRDVKTSIPFSITEDVTSLGRGPFLGIEEKKMSRKQGFWMVLVRNGGG